MTVVKGVKFMVNYQEILDFWFAPNMSEKWFAGGPEFDDEIRERFYDTWLAASRGELAHWRENEAGRVAEIIVLDQFSRNLQRGSHLSYSQDLAALFLAQELLEYYDFDEMEKDHQYFALMPFMHAESRVIQEQSVPLFEEYTNENVLKYAVGHKEIVDKFGRFPHRNEAIGRESTPEEIQFMETHSGY